MRENVGNFSQHQGNLFGKPIGWKSKPSCLLGICTHLVPGPTPCLLLFRGLQRHEKVISMIYNKAWLTTTQETWQDVFLGNRILSATSTSVSSSKVVQECDSMLPHVFPFTTFVSMTQVSFLTPVGVPIEDYHSHNWTGLYNPTTNPQPRFSVLVHSWVA